MNKTAREYYLEKRLKKVEVELEFYRSVYKDFSYENFGVVSDERFLDGLSKELQR